jgi:hypothetical protein
LKLDYNKSTHWLGYDGSSWRPQIPGPFSEDLAILKYPSSPQVVPQEFFKSQ